MGQLAVGHRADLVELDTHHPVLAGRRGDTLLDSWVFAGDARQVRSVHVGGVLRVRDGRSLVRSAVEQAYGQALKEIMDGWTS